MVYDDFESLFRDPPKKPRGKRTPKHDLEGSVQRDCLDALIAHPSVVYVERRNTGAVQFEDGSRISFGQRGAADIWCLVQTIVGGVEILQHVELEMKRRDGKGKLTPSQEKFQAMCERAGIPYYVIENLADLGKALSDFV